MSTHAPGPNCCAVRGTVGAVQGDHQSLKFQALASHWRLFTQVARLLPAVCQILGSICLSRRWPVAVHPPAASP